MRLPSWISQHLAALRALLFLTVALGLAYPLVLVGAGMMPGFGGKAEGSLITRDGTVIGSALIGQHFTDADGNPLPRYFQSRPSAGGDGYDPLATGASNLGPESVVDGPDTPSLLTQVCMRSLAIGAREGVDGGRPYCTPDGVGAVLSVFRADGLTGAVTRAVSVNQACPATPFLTTFEGTAVECANPREDYSGGVVTPVRGTAPDSPAVPADAVTASGSGLDPHISVAYARLQAPRVARERGLPEADVTALIAAHTTGRALGFIGEPAVDVLALNLALDARA
ncbi:potassium-transporting ATPase subunit C [Catenuloplanes indicus]|uniref:Potassium-transporting ATPase KdpC subunit n=1 Tax=Catenuloplanes indicus TaxID=137267 RepID=A0AAE3W613_9ACTN|nr:potassium-transporting ATPase subunit C [Catenuloplanes indicus]MDQ0370151.1 K+-transporting ATPase ATPase C chain [Catenuloplanes indicus]